jgi:mycothiol synthase
MNEPTIVLRGSSAPLRAVETTAVLRLARRAGEHDGAAPLSEQFRMAVEARDGDGVTHVLAYAAERALVGYAQCRADGPGEAPSAELVVDPEHRCEGVGSALLAALPADVRLWDHNGGDAASAFALDRGLQPVRALHFMGRSLQAGPDWGRAVVREGHVVRRFEPGRDEREWLAVNAAAVADHPAQGSLTMADLEQRMAQAWFDPDGFILVVPEDQPDRIAAFHWTKIDPPSSRTGEVYVVGVAPDRQGLGLGRAVTVLGLDHLRDQGLDDVVLYVDEENVAAMHTYLALGFTDRQVHRQYARP